MLILLLLIFGSFFVFSSALSANTDIVINEVGAYFSSDHEWIEIWNKGVEPVDLADWVFFEAGANHGLTVSTTDSVVSPGEYATICQNESNFFSDFPSFSGSVFDSAWFSLNESGEEIGLKDAEGNMVESFSYLPAQNSSLERADPNLLDFSSNNWWPHASANSLGFLNSNFGSIPPTTTPTSTPPEETCNTSTNWHAIKINEIVSNPLEGDEWVELYNSSTSSVNLCGGLLCDSRETTSTCKVLSGEIGGMGWLMIEVGSSYLNNDGDSVVLRDFTEIIVDRVDYAGVIVAGKGQSLARKIDGADTDGDTDWAITTSITPGVSNVITTPPPPSSGGGGSSSAVISTVEVSTQTMSSSSVIINELYPSPGEDEEEFIEIKNTTAETVSLVGWKIGDKVKNYTLSGSIASGEKKYFEKTVTGISLNNTTAEELKLLGPQGQLLGSVKYDKAGSGLSYGRDSLGVWRWSTTITKGEENIFTEPSASAEVEVKSTDDVGIIWKIKYDPIIKAGVTTTFDASRSLDPRGGRINMSWDFGSISLVGNKMNFVFSTSGVRDVVISATSTGGTVDFKKIKLRVYPTDQVLGSGMVINQIAPNEENGDEYIMIKNISPTTTNLSNWKIIANEKVFKIPTSTFLASQDYLTFNKEITNFTLANTGGLIELRMSDDVLADSITYSKCAKGEKITRTADGKVLGVKIAEEAKSPATVKSVVKTSSSKISLAPAVSAKIFDAREMDVGRRVNIQGQVAVLPNIFGTQFFYVYDGEAGIQIYQYKKDFQALQEGDQVQIVGELGVSSNQKRIKLKGRGDVKILEKGRAVTSAEFQIEELQEENAGSLVMIAGEITEIKTSFMYVDNGSDEVKVYFKKNAKIDKALFKEGDMVEVTGVFEMYKTEMQLWPRRQEDVAVLGKSEDLLKKEETVKNDLGKSDTKKYLVVTGLGLGGIILAIFVKWKSQILAILTKFLANKG